MTNFRGIFHPEAIQVTLFPYDTTSKALRGQLHRAVTKWTFFLKRNAARGIYGLLLVQNLLRISAISVW